jgi:glucose-1-phosphate adenylyltransferase
MRSVLALILGGGRGSRLFPLTRSRSKPAVPVAGKYRLIDIPISNCINSDLNSIYVLTQFLSAAQQTNESADWYQGTADAVRQNIDYIRREEPDDVLILSGDQLYRMDFRQLLKTHRDLKADVTLAAIPVAEKDTAGFGLLSMDAHSRVTGFVEKPKTEPEREPFYTSADWIERRGIPCGGRHYLANMGIYAFKTQVLLDVLTAKPLATDFGKEVFPRNYKTKHVCAHLFDGYWEDLGTIRSYHEASLALAGSNPPFDFFSPDGVIYTRMRNLPASRIDGAVLRQSVVADGCVIGADTHIDHSLIGVRSRIGSGCTIRDTVLIGADKFETDEQRAENRAAHRPDLNVGDGAVIERAILDKDCRIGRGARLVNKDRRQDVDGPNGMYYIRDGIICVPRGALIPEGAVV